MYLIMKNFHPLCDKDYKIKKMIMKILNVNLININA